MKDDWILLLSRNLSHLSYDHLFTGGSLATFRRRGEQSLERARERLLEIIMSLAT
jgi:hypothetical protein